LRHHKTCRCQHCAGTQQEHQEFLAKIRDGYEMTVDGLQKPAPKLWEALKVTVAKE